jgi:hypothetical protein
LVDLAIPRCHALDEQTDEIAAPLRAPAFEDLLARLASHPTANSP